MRRHMTEGSHYLKYPASPRSIQEPRAIIQDTLHPTGDSSQYRETLADKDFKDVKYIP